MTDTVQLILKKYLKKLSATTNVGRSAKISGNHFLKRTKRNDADLDLVLTLGPEIRFGQCLDVEEPVQRTE